MPSRPSKPFGEAVLAATNPSGFCVTVLLSWLAAIDRRVTGDEFSFLAISTKKAVKDEAQFRLAVNYGASGALSDLQLACEIVQTLEPKNALLFIELAVGVALADGFVGNAEAYVISFFADLVKVSKKQLDEVFNAATGHVFPTPGDPSSRAWWRLRDSKYQRRRESERTSRNDEETKSRSTECDELELSWTYARLGIPRDSSSVVIRAAYFSLSKIHHPDRFHLLGPDAVKLATENFKRIKDAYEALGSP